MSEHCWDRGSVKTLRLINNVTDNLQSNTNCTSITSGRFGEGLQMRGSDLDIMVVWNQIEICEDTSIYLNADNIHFIMEMGDTKLHLVHNNYWSILKDCNEIGGDFYLNISVKQEFSTVILSTLHGPCMSDDDGIFDIATCAHSKLWIKPATNG
ncbi:unnamed protein product [Mytilus edulis]|uniref:Uncharacterized protein n=1 Tax=Mytilus edulis TaxID=6550 RepID=A0A8S3SLM9_MYTED|nr:unnamed protein product [Mytilus edulis]